MIRLTRKGAWRVRVVAIGLMVAVSAAIAVGAFASGNDNGVGINPNWPAAKQQKMQQILNQRAAARAMNVAKPQNPAPGTPEAIPARVGGLITGLGQSPFPPTEFSSNSTWSGAVGGLWVQIYAGAEITGGTSVGELRGFSMPIDPNDNPTERDSLGTFTPPTATAGLSLTGGQGDVLTVTSTSGDTFSFDLATKTWTGTH